MVSDARAIMTTLYLICPNAACGLTTPTTPKGMMTIVKSTLFFFPPCSLMVMDYDEFSPDDFIGGTRVKLYEVLYSASNKINIRRLLDDNIVSLAV